MKNYYYLLTLFFFPVFCNAQGWEKTFTDFTTSQGKGFDVISTNDGNYVMVGDLDLPTGAIRHYIWLVKTDTEGNEIWSRIFNNGDIENQTGRALVETDDGDLLIVGSNFNKASVLKTSADGDSLWTKDYGGDGENIFRDIIKTDDNNFILTGQYESVNNSGMRMAWAVNITSEGDTLWTNRFFESSGFESSAYHISKLPTNNYLITGVREGQGFAIELDPLTPDQPVWENIHQVSTKDEIFAGTAKSDDNDTLLLAGSALGFASRTPLLINVDATDGTYLSQVPFSTVSEGAITDLIPTIDNGYLLTGSTNEFWDQHFQNIGFITKLNTDLSVAWELSFPDSLDKQGTAIHQNSDGSILIAGSHQNGMFLKKIEDPSTGIFNIPFEKDLVKVFPNPTSKILNFEIPDEYSNAPLSFKLSTNDGKQIFIKDIDQNFKQIEIEHLPFGFYFYTIKNNDQIISSGKIKIQ